MVNTSVVNTYPVPQSAYIHIPFCRRRCYYCDFAISVVGDKLRGENSGTIQEYVQFLCQEISQTPTKESSLDKPLKTIFFGGGTPSLLSVAQLAKILLALDKKFTISPQAEISMEIDPGTFDLDQLQGYRNLGVNRLSLGVQAFQDHLLTLAGRSHNCTDIFHAIDLIHQANYNNWSLDLISGLPQQTLADWYLSLETALKAKPNHISSYDLIVESSTPFAKQYQPGIKPLPEDEITAQMYRLAQQVLTKAGYEHYEISNYAQPDKQCRHNRIYWLRQPYYGFGMGAASYDNQQRFTRPRTRQEYYQWIQNSCVIETPVLELEEMFLEALMLGLRLETGLKIEELAKEFGQDLAEWTLGHLQPYKQQGWVELIGNQGIVDYVRLKDPEGFLFSNTILSNLFHLRD